MALVAVLWHVLGDHLTVTSFSSSSTESRGR